jgi:hypothetical protein
MDIRKYFSKKVLETKGGDIEYLYKSILSQLEEARYELECVKLYLQSDGNNDCQFLDGDILVYEQCEEREKNAYLLTLASLRVKELENVALNLKRMKDGDLFVLDKVEVGSSVG